MLFLPPQEDCKIKFINLYIYYSFKTPSKSTMKKIKKKKIILFFKIINRLIIIRFWPCFDWVKLDLLD
jgi:hypothetical protein